eukprot:54359_1
MSALLLGEPFSRSVLDFKGPILPWVEGVLESSDREIRLSAALALTCFLRHSRGLLAHFADQAYRPGIPGRCYMGVVGDAWLEDDLMVVQLDTLLHLSVYKLGDPSPTIRSLALRIAAHISDRFPPNEKTSSLQNTFRTHLCGGLPDSYTETQLELSRRLAAVYPSQAQHFVYEMSCRLRKAPKERIRNMLRYCVPWMSRIHLGKIDSPHSVLHTLVSITLCHCDEYAPEMESLWFELAFCETNIACALSYLLKWGTDDSQPPATPPSQFFRSAQRIALFLSRRDLRVTVRLLVDAIGVCGNGAALETEQIGVPFSDDLSPNMPSLSTSNDQVLLHSVSITAQPKIDQRMFLSGKLPEHERLLPVGQQQETVGTDLGILQDSQFSKLTVSNYALLLMVDITYE